MAPTRPLDPGGGGKYPALDLVKTPHPPTTKPIPKPAPTKITRRRPVVLEDSELRERTTRQTRGSSLQVARHPRPQSPPPSPDLPLARPPSRPQSPKPVTPSTTPPTPTPTPTTSGPRNPAPVQHPTNRVLIGDHVAGANNPFHLARVIRQANLKIPVPKNHYNHTKSSTLLVFQSRADAEEFISKIPAAPTFGTVSKYTYLSPPKTQAAKSSTSRAPLLHVVVRGVHVEIDERDFLQDVEFCDPNPCTCGRGFTRARRITARDDQPTGLVRLFTACQTCCAAALKGGLSAHGRSFRVEPPRNPLIRPCGKCHGYGHDSRDCAEKLPVCRVCGFRVRDGSPCSHQGHDLSQPYCATCNKFGHYTGQRSCPRYPRDEDPPAPTHFVPAPQPSTNPWNMKLQDFPDLGPTPSDKPSVMPDTPATEQASPPDPADTATPSEHEAGSAPTTKPTRPTKPKTPPTATLTDRSDNTHSNCVTLDSLKGFLEHFLTSVSEGFQRTFDAVLAVLLTIVKPADHKKVRSAVNSVTKRTFDMRTIFQEVGSGLSVLHSQSKRNHKHGSSE